MIKEIYIYLDVYLEKKRETKEFPLNIYSLQAFCPLS